MYRRTDKCRICGNPDLIPILDLGVQVLTGIFPEDRSREITRGPLELVKCNESDGSSGCGLVQLRHSYDKHELYGRDYGYRSGLNQSMVRHLHQKVSQIMGLLELKRGDLIIDTGSNDSTLLRAYPRDRDLLLAGVDPVGWKFREYYPSHIHLIPEFFSDRTIRKEFGGKKAKVITSIAMFYDVEDPVDFMGQLHNILDDDGIWVFEQSYLPAMLALAAYDTVCHEHLEYYGLRQIKWMTDRVGFDILSVELNGINGGSFSVAAAKKKSSGRGLTEAVKKLLYAEEADGLATLRPYQGFSAKVSAHREKLLQFLAGVRNDQRTIIGYGASTKGNVVLQYCGITEDLVPYIADINEDKIGAYTPGTLIPIISEKEARKMNPDYFMILPWHFRESIIERESRYLDSGGRLFFPLPSLEVYGKKI